MTRLKRLRHLCLGLVVVVVLIACQGSHRTISQSLPPPSLTSPLITTTPTGEIRVEPPAIAPQLRNAWTPDLEAEFWQRANSVIQFYAGQPYGNTVGENEKRSYPTAMLDFLAGHREKALAFLQAEDADQRQNAHTKGIDYYYAFTLKGQIRKYFFLGSLLTPAYHQRMYEGAKAWTAQDPKGRPHPLYGNGNRQNDQGWSPLFRGGWVDGRNTDNLRAMRETSVYLMAEETGNEATRRLYKQKIQRYVWALYSIGMGEWDSETYHGHTFTAYLNLYDFAKDPEVKSSAKAALDWLSAAAAVKYYRGGFAGPNKRDYGHNAVFTSATARLFWLYFGDAAIANPKPEPDSLYVITSAYRPPLAVVALARKQIQKPVELYSSKPTYENWKPGGDTRPAYWETTFLGQTYQMGSVVSESSDADVSPFKLLAESSNRGVDYVVANSGDRQLQPGKHPGDQIAQFRNLLIWLGPGSQPAVFLQIPKSTSSDITDQIWFFQLDKTWLALHPIQLNPYTELPPLNTEAAKPSRTNQTVKNSARDDVILQATIKGDRYAGFALEVGDPSTYASYPQFKQAVLTKSQLDLSRLAHGTVTLTSSTGDTLKIVHQAKNDLPTVTANGLSIDWFKRLDLYSSPQTNSPISLGWKRGQLIIQAGTVSFKTGVDPTGRLTTMPE